MFHQHLFWGRTILFMVLLALTEQSRASGTGEKNAKENCCGDVIKVNSHSSGQLGPGYHLMIVGGTSDKPCHTGFLYRVLYDVLNRICVR